LRIEVSHDILIIRKPDDKFFKDYGEVRNVRTKYWPRVVAGSSCTAHPEAVALRYGEREVTYR